MKLLHRLNNNIYRLEFVFFLIIEFFFLTKKLLIVIFYFIWWRKNNKKWKNRFKCIFIKRTASIGIFIKFSVQSKCSELKKNYKINAYLKQYGNINSFSTL